MSRRIDLFNHHANQNSASSTANSLLNDIKTNTANINVNVGDVEINAQQLEDLVTISNAKLVEISAKNTDIDNSVKANAVTVAKLNQILVKNTEIDSVLDSCSAKLTDVDDSVKANSVTVAKLNQILVKNGELKTLLTDISAKTTDVDDSVKANANVVSKLTQIKNLTDTFDATLDSSLVKQTAILAKLDDTVATSGSGAASDKLQQVGGKFLDGTSRHIRTDTLGRVEVDIHTGGVTDTRLGAIQTAVQLLDNAISGNEFQCDVLTMPTVAVTNSALTELASAINLDRVDVTVTNNISGFSTSAKQDVIEASLTSMEGKMDVDNVVYDNQLTKLTACATDLAAIEVLLTSANTDHAANEALLTTIDSDTDSIKTSTAACATDLAAIEVLQTAANTDLAAIEVLLTSANTDHAANEALLITIDADTNNIKTSTAACATDLAAIEVLLTSANTDHAANEALLTTIDSDTNNIKTSTAACATDLAAIEVLQTAANTDLAAIEVLLTSANTDHAANEALLTTIDSDTDAIKTSAAAIATDIAANEILITAGNALLTTIDADTGAIKTAVELIDDVVHAEDSAHSNTDKGIPCLVVRKDTQTQLAGSDADYGMIQSNATGALRTHNNKVFTTEATLHATIDIPSGGGAQLSAVIVNDPNISRYHLHHIFETNNSVKYRIVQANTANQNPYITIGDPSVFFNDASSPAGAATNGLSPDIEVQLPFFKIEYFNSHNANQEAVMNFVGLKSQ